MQVTAQQVFKDLDSGTAKPFYLVVGEEPFQTDEIVSRIKAFFLKSELEGAFNLESWDGEHCDVLELHASLDTLPGLFDSGATRLVICRHFDKISPSGLEKLQRYFENPSETTCFLMLATKADKRKAWYRAIDERGYVMEVAEPYEREWPKWHSFFERKVEKRILPDAWECLVAASGRSLSVLWTDLKKVSTFVGDSKLITAENVQAMGGTQGAADIFGFAEDVIGRKKASAIERYHWLVTSGESEIKILSILVRQFRQVAQYLEMARRGITDSKAIAAQIGINPYFVSKIAAQAKGHTLSSVGEALHQLADCDFRMKTGEGSLFPDFLAGYFLAQKV